jgi:DNA-directed RNA polymerase specialized sigma24 family protein
MEGEALWLRAHFEAHNCLRRFHDTWTREHRDDLAQEAAVAAWRWASSLRHHERYWAAVHTIALRTRARWLRMRRPPECDSALLAVACIDPHAPERMFVVGGRRVAASRLRPWVREALQRLKPLDRGLLLGFYEGVGCSELAERFRRSRACVKTRIHRARRRVQKDVETTARTAVGLDD